MYLKTPIYKVGVIIIIPLSWVIVRIDLLKTLIASLLLGGCCSSRHQIHSLKIKCEEKTLPFFFF